MADVVYREICPHPEDEDKWKDITINGGASQSTLQDIKLPQTTGCFHYRNSRHFADGTSNRFIFWHTNNDVLELVEVSLDMNLRGNHLRLRFQHRPILQGVSIHETSEAVIVLVATVFTIHKFSFMHPSRVPFMDHFLKDRESIVPSVFFDTTLEKLQGSSNYHVLNHTSLGVPLPHTSCSFLLTGGKAAFVLANSAGSLQLVVMTGEQVTCNVELNKTSIMSRFLSGILRSTPGPGEMIVSIVCHQDNTDNFIFTLNRNLKIHMYSQNREECLMEASVIERGDDNAEATRSYNEQCLMKKSVCTNTSDYFLGVCVSLTQQNQFFVYQPLCINEKYQLSYVATLHHRKHDLVDFCVTSSHIWTLWLNPSSEPVVKVTSFERGSYVGDHINWLTMEMEPPVPRRVFVTPGHLDPKSEYVKEIFHQGRFSASTILKAVNILKRGKISSEASLAGQPGYLEALKSKEEIIKFIDNEILSMMQDTDFRDQDYTQKQIQYWDKFLSYCIQYHEVETKPLGLSYDSESGCAIVIKKNAYSILHPYEPFEQLIASSDDSNLSSCISLICGDDTLLCSSLLAVCECIALVQKNLSREMIIYFEQSLHQLKCSFDVAQDVAKKLRDCVSDLDGCFLSQVQSHLRPASSILAALKLIIQMVDLSPKDSFEIMDLEEPPYAEYPHFLNGDGGISILCEGISQFIKQRYQFCRNLLLLEIMMSNVEENCGMSSETIAKIQNEIIPQTKTLVHVYFALKWCCDCEYIPKKSSELEMELGQLSLLDLPDVSASFPATSKRASDSDGVLGKTIVYYFLVDQGRTAAYSLLSSQLPYESFCEKEWSACVPQLIANAVKLLWPLGPYFNFLEYLLTQGQCVQLQSYISLLQPWCEWNAYSLLFFSANCALILGEHWKAVDLFIKAAEGVEKADYLYKKITQGMDDASSSVAAQYYLKVIQLFEHGGLSECIIKLGMKAIGTLHKEDPCVPTFWSLVFKHHLELGHDEEAFTALTKNPDSSRQKDCLRQLVFVLVERKKFQTLIEFPYGDIQDDVVTMLESRARSSDLLNQNFYDLLYSFHVHTSNFRKAASTMFEYGMRLGQEVPSLEGLKKQASCFLVTLNCLNIVNRKYAWIVKPVPKVEVLANGMRNENAGMSPKRNIDDEMQPLDTNVSKGIEVLEISDIHRECVLIQARLLLACKSPSNIGVGAPSLSPSDCVALLINAGLLEEAIKLCRSFSLDLTPVFEGLTYLCIKRVQQKAHFQSKKNNEKENYEWVLPNCSNIFESYGCMSASKQLLYILKKYLDMYEAPNETKFHRYVVSKFLSSGIHIPAWLCRSYQKRNPSELLYLYLNFGLLETATNLVLDYMDAVMGYGEKDFGIKYPIHTSVASRVWLPHSYIDILVDALEDSDMYAEHLSKLKEKIDLYNEKVKSVSEAILMTSV